MKWMYLIPVLAVLACLTLGPAQHAADVGDEARPVRFQATVWQVTMTDKQALDLDSRQLATTAKTAAAMFARLAAIGPARVLHHLDEAPDPSGEKAIGTTSKIAVVNSIHNTNKNTITVSYAEKTVGVTLRLSWRQDGAGLLSVRMHGSLAAPIDKAVRLKGVPDNVDIEAVRNIDMHNCEFSYFGEVALDDPQVIVRVVADPREQDVAYAYVVRMVFSDPQP